MNLNELRRRHRVQTWFLIAVIYLTDPRNWRIFSLKRSWKTKLTLKNLTGYPPTPPTLETSWLDGVRGISALFVMLHHYGWDLYWPKTYEAPYGATVLNPAGVSISKPYTQFWRLPFFRILVTSGHTQVSIFFVLSGFVLSWGALGTIQKGDTSKVVESLASATLRRWMRLYLPCFAVSFFGCIQTYMVWKVNATLPKESFRAQVWDWVLANDGFGDFTKLHRVTFGTLHAYNYVMWTIPLEFEGSMFVFVLLLVLSRVRKFWRRTMVIALVSAYSYFKAHWTYWLFSSGVLLANYVRRMGGFKKLTERKTRVSTVLWCTVFLVALLLMGTPQKSEDNIFSRPGYEWLDSLVPFDWLQNENGSRLWFSWSGLLFVVCAIHSPVMQRVYNMRFPRYIGRISFMLHITHDMVGDTIGKALRTALYKHFGRGIYVNEMANTFESGNPFSTFFMYIVVISVEIPIALFVAHWVTVLVDEPAVKFAKFVERWLTMGGERHEKSLPAEANAGLLPLHSQGEYFPRQELGRVPILVTNEDEDDEYKEDAALLATQVEMSQVTLPGETVPQRRKEDEIGLA